MKHKPNDQSVATEHTAPACAVGHRDIASLGTDIKSWPAGARAALQKLPTVHYLLLHQLYIERLSIAEIAGNCGCSEATVSWWREHAEQAFVRQLRNTSVTPSKPKGQRPSPHSTSAELFHLHEVNTTTGLPVVSILATQKL